jgi:hypothetical protein
VGAVISKAPGPDASAVNVQTGEGASTARTVSPAKGQ